MVKILECHRCHRLFKSTDEHIFIHTKTKDVNWCEKCTTRALQLMDDRIDKEASMKLNRECMDCPLRVGCLTECATQPEDVIKPPCGRYAIGICADRNNTFWTRPADVWQYDRFNLHPEDLLYVVVDLPDDTEVRII